jgi:hypothetical protein
MAGSRNATLSRQSLVYPAALIAGDVRLVEPDANIDPCHAAAAESQGVDKPAQRRAPSGLRLRRIVSVVKRDWLPPLVRRGQSRWGERVDLNRGEGLLFSCSNLRREGSLRKRGSNCNERLCWRHDRHDPPCELRLVQGARGLEERPNLGQDFVRLGVLRRETHERARVLKLPFEIRRPLAARLGIDEVGHSDGSWSFEKRLDFGEEGFPETVEWIAESPPRLEEARENAPLLRRNGHPLTLDRREAADRVPERD